MPCDVVDEKKTKWEHWGAYKWNNTGKHKYSTLSINNTTTRVLQKIFFRVQSKRCVFFVPRTTHDCSEYQYNDNTGVNT